MLGREGHEARQPLRVLRADVGEELERDCHPSSSALADAIRERHGTAVAAVLFYGSCLRQDPADDPPEGIQDFYAIVDSYRDIYPGRWQAFVNRLLPPNVFYLEQSWQGRTVRAKYAVIDRTQLRRGTSSKAFHPYFWARFAQPVALPYVRDEQVRAETTAAIAEAVRTMLTTTAPLNETPITPRSLWLTALGLTYGSELRPEGKDRAALIYEADRERYDLMAERVFDLTARADGSLELAFTDAEYRRTHRLWQIRKILGKPLTVFRLIKSLFTFDGGVDYALWKVERHTGVRVPVSAFERRHPVLTSPRLLWRVFRLSAVR